MSSKTKSSKTLMLIFVPVATVLILALAWDGQGGESVAPAAIVQGPGTGSSEVYDRTPDVVAELAAIESITQAPAAPSSVPTAASGVPVGRITGRLVDAAGRGIPNEPVVVGLADDPFVRGDDDRDTWTIVAKSVSDEDGHFSVGAHPNVVLELMAGGNRWARHYLEPVVHSDDLRIVLEEGYMLEGTVFDATGLQLPGARVGAGADSITYTTRADEAGQFKLGPLPAEDVLVGAWADGHDVWFKGASPALGGITIELETPPAVTGRVVDSVTGAAVPSGTVVLRLDAEAFPQGTSELVPRTVQVHTAEAQLAEDGSFSVPEGVSYGFLLEVASTGYVPLEYDRYEDRGYSPERSDIVLYMRPQLPVIGTAVVHATGAAASGAWLELESGPDAAPLAQAAADAQGRFELPVDDWEGRDRLWVVATDAEGHGARVRSREADADLELALVPQLDVLVRVTLGGEPVHGAQIVAHSKDGRPTNASSDEQGLARVRHVIAGPETERVRLAARDAYNRSLPLQIDLGEPRPDPDVPLELALDGGLSLVGHVHDPFGNPVPSALAEVRRGPVAHTDAEGRFSLGPLAYDESVSLEISADDFHAERLELVPDATEVQVTLRPVLRWRGRVVDTATGQSPETFVGRLQVENLEDGGVAWSDTKQRVTRGSGVSGVSGEFSVAMAEPGRYRLRLSAKGYVDAYTASIDFDGIRAPLYTDVLMSPAALLEVTVLDGVGRPVPGLSLSVVPWQLATGDRPTGKARKAGARGRTDEAGRTSINLGSGGDFRVALGSVWADGLRLTITPGPSVRRDFLVPSTGDLELTVLDEEGQPLRGGRLAVKSTGSDYEVSRRGVVRGEDGKVTVNALPPGTYSVIVSHRGRPPAGEEVLVLEAQFLRLDLYAPMQAPEGDGAAQGGAAQVFNVYDGKGKQGDKGGMGGMGGKDR